jgi:hypothetical protein
LGQWAIELPRPKKLMAEALLQVQPNRARALGQWAIELPRPKKLMAEALLQVQPNRARVEELQTSNKYHSTCCKL